MNEQLTPYEFERRKALDFTTLKSVMHNWQSIQTLPWLFEVIVDDVTPVPDEGLNFNDRRVNEQRKLLLTLLSREEYVTPINNRDQIAYGLSEASSLVEDGSLEQKALITLLQTYRVQQVIAPRKADIIDPRGLAFRVINPINGRHRERSS